MKAVKPGYHMSKIHWNTVAFNNDVSDKMIMELLIIPMIWFSKV